MCVEKNLNNSGHLFKKEGDFKKFVELTLLEK